MKVKTGQMSKKQTFQEWWINFKAKFITLYKLKVSYNNVWGDSDDEEFIIKKVIKRTKDSIKFRTEQGDVVEMYGAEGLNIKIEQL